MKKLLKTVVPTVFLLSTHLAYADSGEFKRWSVSAGWLHVMPQGKANTFNINTAAKEGTVSSVGSISKDGFLDSIDPDAPHRLGGTQKDKASTILNGALGSVLLDANGNVKSNYTGKATING